MATIGAKDLYGIFVRLLPGLQSLHIDFRHDEKNGILGKPEPIDGVSDDERTLLGEAFRALRRERGAVWNAACDTAEAQAKRPPSLRVYGIDDIRRLARRLGIRATHWMEE